MEPIALAERLGRWSVGRGPLYLLLAAGLRRLIDDAELPPGASLPPDRRLAAALAVGRTTVVAAYDLLRDEGRIVRHRGSGTRVAGPAVPPAAATTGAPVFLHLLAPEDGVIPLACAAPDAPPPEVAAAYARVAPRLAAIRGDIGYHPAGYPALRRAIADRYRARGVPTEPAQIMVTNGGQQALSLITRLLVSPGDRVLVEAPTYPGAIEALRDAAAVLRTLPPGLDGIAQAVREHRPTLAYVIATFHNPTGAVLTVPDRRRLAAAGMPLVDDEVLADLAFPGVEPPPPLAAYDDTVITIGSLSKSLWGGLRVGWVRGPEPLVARLTRLRAVHDLGGDVLTQLAAAELLPDLTAICARGAADLHARHDHLRAELAHRLPEWDAPAVTGGQTLWVRLPYGDAASYAQAALRHGVAVLPGDGLDASGRGHAHLRLHFRATPADLSEAVRRLATAWRAYHPPESRTGTPPALAI